MIIRTVRGYKLVVGWNSDRRFLYGVKRQKVGPRGSFTAIACWPLIVGISGRKPNGERW